MRSNYLSKKLSAALAALTIVLLAGSASGQIVNGTDGNFDYACSNELTAIITGYSGSSSGAVTIPETLLDVVAGYDNNGDPIYRDLTVTGIGDEAFAYNSGLTGVTIPASVTGIGVAAFGNCTSLSSVTMPGSVSSIGDEAFIQCTSLRNLTLPNSLTSLGNGVFSDCTSLTVITVPNSITNLGNSAFAECYDLTTVSIPTNLTSIGSNVFGNCHSLAAITIPGNVTNIGISAFMQCSKLVNLSLPDKVASIEAYAFEDCSSLTNVTLGNGVGIIGTNAFASCSRLASLTVPANVTNLEDGAFASCSSLNYICFQGAAPTDEAVEDDSGNYLFEHDPLSTIYYVEGASGWNETYDTILTSSCAECNAGSLQVTITPQGATDAGAQWSIDGGNTWWSSGVTNLPSGQYTVEFNTIANWISPPSQTVTVANSRLTTVTGNYIPSGSLEVTITPQGAVNSGAKWSVDGVNWWDSGVTLYSVATGEYTVRYKPVPDWIAPPNQLVVITNAQLTATNGNYTQPISFLTGGLKVTLEPPAAATDGAQWNVNGGTWQNTSAIVASLPPGTDVVSFLTIYGWNTPTNESAIITADKTNSIVATYLPVTNQLALGTVGLGTFSPNYSNAWLQIGASYKITAVPASGFVFTNWTVSTNGAGSVTVPSRILTFTMASNLTLLATFVETSRPSLNIKLPTAGQRWSNAVFTASGTAMDKVDVASVQYQLNNGGWNPATGSSQWSANLNLNPGTNVLSAYAINVAGISSITNTVSFDYVVTNQLGLQVVGLGTVSPNYSNAWLELGRNYSITSSPASGFVFTNWTVSTNWLGGQTTNSRALHFTMAPNLTLLATFVETSRPALTITLPTAGQRWSNAVFTASGTATDKWEVAGVQYQLNNGGWSTATGTNRWTASLNLNPGTNVLSAYAINVAGISSITNTVSFDYVVTNQLGLQVVGLGTVSPNYSNAWLELGRNYSITSSPAGGFVFTNWTVSTNWLGGQTTNSRALHFTMAPNLTLLATFVETSRPSLTITLPTAGQRWSNALFNASGTATDKWEVASVQYQLNNGGWSTASGTNRWTASLNLNPGTNVLSAYAINVAGINSITNNVRFDYVVTNQLGIQTVGLGTLSPNYSNAWLEIGRNYSITSSPASGFVFTNWTVSTNWLGGSDTNNRALHFMMASNLTLLATFVETSSPSLTITAPTNGQHLNAAQANAKGALSDKWGLAGVWYQVNGGGWNAATTNGWTNWTATVTLAAGTNTIQAYAQNLGGNYSKTNSVTVVANTSADVRMSVEAAPLQGNGMTFTLHVAGNTKGRLEYSTDLIKWQSWTNFECTNGVITFHDPDATNSPQRFYRAVIP